ncbi:ABC transporter substrate-binding protein [Clostridium sp. MSJ-11]|uniref:ABC transporter substrate-binding protein n=1 Tax=Clostridium mobile TaxID=2841512 RepID=A0ABS6EJC6_9CLOT|nr:ABC transporter substrate-binding protein [Clostridium mobile]MBU5484555.1 ABC transporter substrate-binding protein [Clostridium mobile]
MNLSKMKKILTALILGMTMVAFVGCSTKTNTDPSPDSKEIKEESTLENKDSKIKYATKFNVEYLDNNVKLVIDGADRKLLLVPKGEKKPEGYDDIQVINTPIDNVLLCSSMQTSLIRPLNVFDTIGAVTTYDIDKGHIDEVNDRMKSGAITYVGRNTALDYELIKSKKPEVAFIIASDVAKLGAKFDELEIPYVVEASAAESHPLGRMEWIEFMSLFYNKEAEADKHLQKAEETINKVSEKVKGKNKPVATAGVIYDGKFSVRVGGSYQSKMYEIAGGDYTFKDFQSDKTGAASITNEEFYARSTKADIYVFEGMGKTRPKTISEFVSQAPIIENMKSIKNGELWSSQPWWSQSVDKLDEIIEDLAAIFYPEEFKGHEVRHYFKVENK